MMLPAASSLPFGSSPSSRRIQRIQNPSACNWIQPPTPLLAHQSSCGPGVQNNNAYLRLHHPHSIEGFLTKDQTIMSDADSKETTERMRQSLPYPNAMLAASSSSPDLIFPPSTLSDLQRQSTSSQKPFPFNRTPCTSFSTNTTAGAFVFSGEDLTARRKRKSLSNGSRQSWKKRCPEERMVAHMSRLTLNSKAAQLNGEDHCDDEDEWGDSEDEEESPFQIGISPELKCALRGNEIIPEKLLSSMPSPNKSGMELVIWRPPGTIVPSEIIASISSHSQILSSPKLNPPSKPDNDGGSSSSTRLALLRDPVIGPRNSNFNVDSNPNSNMDDNLNLRSNNVDGTINDMEMDTV